MGCVCDSTGRPPDPASGVCPCPNGLILCGGICVDHRKDPAKL
jgi:hypothetical protein